MRKSIKAAKATVAALVSNVPAIIEPVTPVALETVTNADINGGTVLDNDTGATIEPVAVEATPDPRAAKSARIAADRAIVRSLYAAFEANRASVPVKAISAFKLATTTPHPVTRSPSMRQAAAIAVALAAAGVKLSDGASAPRVFEANGVNSAIENGVLRDALSSGLITVSGATPEAEIITVRAKAAATISGLLGSTLLKAGNLI